MELAIETHGLVKKFRSFRGLGSILSPRGRFRLMRETVALDGIDLQVPRGSVYGLLGRNGAGKTTTVQLLMGLLEPTAGDISVLGLHPLKQDVELKRRVGHVADGQKMYEFYTIEELCDFASVFYPSWNRKLQDELIDRFDLPRDQRLAEFSRGMKAQAALVLALSHEPELLLMGESTSGLDAVIRRQFLESIVEMSHESHRTVVLSSHIIDDMERVCDWVGLIHKGKLIIQSPLEDLKKSVKQLRVVSPHPMASLPRAVSEHTVRLEQLNAETLITVKSFTRQMVDALQAAGATRVEVDDLSLEEIFVALTTGAERQR